MLYFRLIEDTLNTDQGRQQVVPMPSRSQMSESLEHQPVQHLAHLTLSLSLPLCLSLFLSLSPLSPNVQPPMICNSENMRFYSKKCTHRYRPEDCALLSLVSGHYYIIMYFMLSFNSCCIQNISKLRT